MAECEKKFAEPVLVCPRALGQHPGSSEKSRMTSPAVRDAIYSGRVFNAEIIDSVSAGTSRTGRAIEIS